MKNLFTFLLLLISLNIFANSIRDKALEITKNDVTDIQKISSITQWIYSNIKYDKELANCEDCSRETVDTYTYVYNNRKGVCVGMSNLFKYMTDANGLKTYVVGGIGIVSSGSGDHAWNAVETNKGYVLVDVTWNIVTTNKAEFDKKHKYESIYLDYSVGGIQTEIDEKTKYHQEIYLNYVYIKDEILYSNLSVDAYIDSMTIEARKKGHGYHIGYGQRINMEHAVRFREVNRYLLSDGTTPVSTVTKTVTDTTPTSKYKNFDDVKYVDVPLIISMSNSDFKKLSQYDIYPYRDEVYKFVYVRGSKSMAKYAISNRGKNFITYIKGIRKSYRNGSL